MNRELMKLTTSQFAQLHHLNKRTLHYYDHIGLFSPAFKNENNYRYYDYGQSIELEYILMLKELHMSIEEIKDYLKCPQADEFIKLSDIKIKELEIEIHRLKQTKEELERKRDLLMKCDQIDNYDIKVIDCKASYILKKPYQFHDDHITEIYQSVKETYDPQLYRLGLGTYITVDKIKNNDFDEYDGFFIPVPHKIKNKDLIKRPQGKYLCGYLRGAWEGLPLLYNRMLKYAKDNNIELMGDAYEIGLNEFAIADMDEYVTQVLVQVQ